MSIESQVVYVGRKPPMNYVLAVVTSFSASNANDVTLKARGRAISTAVDVAEISRRRFFNDVTVGKISIGSEDIAIKEENRVRTVSTVEITLTRVPMKEALKAIPETNESVLPQQTLWLSSVKGIGDKTTEKLKACGITSIQNLANFDPKTLAEKLQISEKRVTKGINEAKKLM